MHIASGCLSIFKMRSPSLLYNAVLKPFVFYPVITRIFNGYNGRGYYIYFPELKDLESILSR